MVRKNENKDLELNITPQSHIISGGGLVTSLLGFNWNEKKNDNKINTNQYINIKYRKSNRTTVPSKHNI